MTVHIALHKRHSVVIVQIQIEQQFFPIERNVSENF